MIRTEVVAMTSLREHASDFAERDRDGSHRRSRLLFSLKVLGIFTLYGLVTTGEAYFGFKDTPLQESWLHAFSRQMPIAYSWAFLTPLVLWAIRRWDFSKGRRMRSAVGHLCTIALVVPLQAGLDAFLMDLFRFLLLHRTPDLLRTFTLDDFMAGVFITPFDSLTIAAILSAGDYYRKYRERELAASRFESALAQARLQALRTQLNPHFLYNTLQAIAALSRKDAEATHRMVTLLGGLLRRSLEGSDRQEVPLREELDFVRDYLAIQHERFSDRLTVEYDVSEEALDLSVPSFLLQPLAENAVRHGIGPRPEPGRVCIRARIEGGSLELTVEDNGLGLQAAGFRGEGRGLSLTRARLSSLYGEKAGLEVADREGGGVVAVVRLPLRSTEGAERTEATA
jgi:two-component system, LytTR family, sensor kinase